MTYNSNGFTPISGETRLTSLDSTNSTPVLTLTPPRPTTLPTVKTKAPATYFQSAGHQPTQVFPPAELPASIPQRAGITPELDDTGFYRQRAELAAYSQSELINIPLEQRKSRVNMPSTQLRAAEEAMADATHRKRAELEAERTRTSSSSHQKPAKGSFVITPEGVVLGANLEQLPSASHRGREDAGRAKDAGSGQNAHVMSFMDFESGESSVKCAGLDPGGEDGQTMSSS